MQATFWRNVAILDTRRVFCFVLAIFAVLFALLANVDHQFILVHPDGGSAKMSHIFSYFTGLMVFIVGRYYRR